MEPSTGKYIKLPFSGLSRKDGHVRFGFGYDIVSDDFNVVRIAQFSGSDIVSENGPFFTQVHVYSLKSNSWKKLAEEFPYFLQNREEPGIYLNGALHWVYSSKMNTATGFLEECIVAIDLATERGRVVPHPPCTDEIGSVKLEVLGGSLCSLYTCWDENIYTELRNLDPAGSIDATVHHKPASFTHGMGQPSMKRTKEMAKTPVPESVLKKQKRSEEWALAKKQELEAARRRVLRTGNSTTGQSSMQRSTRSRS